MSILVNQNIIRRIPICHFSEAILDPSDFQLKLFKEVKKKFLRPQRKKKGKLIRNVNRKKIYLRRRSKKGAKSKRRSRWRKKIRALFPVRQLEESILTFWSTSHNLMLSLQICMHVFDYLFLSNVSKMFLLIKMNLLLITGPKSCLPYTSLFVSC